jgi:transposase-like protein
MKKLTRTSEQYTAIYPLYNISEEEIEAKKFVAFYHAVDLMKQEGYILNKDLTAIHEDADKPYFKAKFCKNGWELRRITNIEGWMVIIRYQRYRTRQQKKVRGVEKPTEFTVIAPRKQHHSKATKEAVKELYKMGHTVSQIIRAYEIQRGIELKPGTVRNWVSEVGRRSKDIEVDIFELEKALERKIKERALIEKQE